MVIALVVLTILTFSKNVYVASLSSYYTFYAIHKFGVSVQESQLMLFLFLGASAAGLVLGGLFGDRFGAKTVIWFSILGVLPFTLALPYADLFWTNILAMVIGLILSSAFSAIVVFAQELVPGRVGMIAGIFFGLAFGAAASVRRCSASSPTTRASTTSSGSARSCRCSGCSPSSCRT